MIYYKNKKQIKFKYIIRGVLPLGIGLIMRVMLGPQLFFFCLRNQPVKFLIMKYRLNQLEIQKEQAGEQTPSTQHSLKFE